MKKSITKGLLLAILLCPIALTTAHAQAKPPTYRDMVGDNPNAEADIKLVTDYVHALAAGEIDKAMTMLAPDYKGRGPGPEDSADVQKTAASWKTNMTTQKDSKASFVAETFNVKSGENAGHWVATWGSYTFTQDGKTVSFPYQYTAHIKNGKIDRDAVYYDQSYIMKTLGFTITPPAK